jgi:hypothetical protein
MANVTIIFGLLVGPYLVAYFFHFNNSTMAGRLGICVVFFGARLRGGLVVVLVAMVLSSPSSERALLMRDRCQRRVHRPLHFVRLSAKWAHDTLWYFLRTAVWPRNGKRFSALDAGDDFLHHVSQG